MVDAGGAAVNDRLVEDVTLETIQNRVAANRLAGKYTWVFVDEVYLFFRYYYSIENQPSTSSGEGLIMRLKLRRISTGFLLVSRSGGHQSFRHHHFKSKAQQNHPHCPHSTMAAPFCISQFSYRECYFVKRGNIMPSPKEKPKAPGALWPALWGQALPGVGL